jgi:hypothetical protein
MVSEGLEGLEEFKGSKVQLPAAFLLRSSQ